MNERIDHAAEARNYIACWEEEAGQNAELDMALAQLHATLAVAEQLRIGNVLTLAESGRTTVNGARAAMAGLYSGTVEDGTARMTVRPEVAAALGIGEAS